MLPCITYSQSYILALLPLIKQLCFEPVRFIPRCFQPPVESGCDELVSLRVWYKPQESKTTVWMHEDMQEVKGFHHALIRAASGGEFEVKVTATNNENISASSESVKNVGKGKLLKTLWRLHFSGVINVSIDVSTHAR